MLGLGGGDERDEVRRARERQQDRQAQRAGERDRCVCEGGRVCWWVGRGTPEVWRHTHTLLEIDSGLLII